MPESENVTQETTVEIPGSETVATVETPDSAAPKKRRGRPPGSGKKTAEQIEAGSASEAAKPQKRQQKVSFDKAQIAMMGKQLVGLHVLAAHATGIPECVINEQEGETLATAIAGVCEQYNLAVDGKTGAMLQLFGASAMIYAPRYMHLRKRMAEAQAKHDAQNTVDVQGTVINGASVPTH